MKFLSVMVIRYCHGYGAFLVLVFLPLFIASCGNSAIPEKSESSKLTTYLPVVEQQKSTVIAENVNVTVTVTDSETETQHDSSTISNELPSGPVEQKFNKNDIQHSVIEVASTLEKLNLAYAVEPLSDCSGIFHRVLRNVKADFPGAEMPNPDDHRTTRLLAKWYHEKNRLTLVRSPVDSSDVIEPGVVLFYGQVGGKLPKPGFTAEDLFVQGTGINHMGVVVDVVRDDSGNLQRYSLFHGRNPKYPASTTTYHKITSKPPFGNGSEKWVAYAPILPSS